MNKELTAEEYLKRYDALKIIDKVFTNEPYVVRPSDTQMSLAVDAMVTHGDLRAKEAVEKFARELCKELVSEDYWPDIVADVFKIAKQHGVNL